MDILLLPLCSLRNYLFDVPPSFAVRFPIPQFVFLQTPISLDNLFAISGKTYYVRIRTYKTINGAKVYSPYASAKSVKIK